MRARSRATPFVRRRASFGGQNVDARASSERVRNRKTPSHHPPPQTPACPAILPRNLPTARSPRARGASQVDRARGGNKTVALDRSAFFCWGFLQISPVWGDWRAHAPGVGVCGRRGDVCFYVFGH